MKRKNKRNKYPAKIKVYGNSGGVIMCQSVIFRRNLQMENLVMKLHDVTWLILKHGGKQCGWLHVNKVKFIDCDHREINLGKKVSFLLWFDPRNVCQWFLLMLSQSANEL